MKVDAVTGRGPIWNLRETETYPGVDLGQAELTTQLQRVHRPGEQAKYKMVQIEILRVRIHS